LLLVRKTLLLTSILQAWHVLLNAWLLGSRYLALFVLAPVLAHNMMGPESASMQSSAVAVCLLLAGCTWG
jgi:glucose dehydrogenase